MPAGFGVEDLGAEGFEVDSFAVPDLGSASAGFPNVPKCCVGDAVEKGGVLEGLRCDPGGEGFCAAVFAPGAFINGE